MKMSEHMTSMSGEIHEPTQLRFINYLNVVLKQRLGSAQLGKRSERELCTLGAVLDTILSKNEYGSAIGWGFVARAPQ